MATKGVIVRGSEADREAYAWARSDQGYEGTWEDWCEMPLNVRREYEEGATGGVCSPKRIVPSNVARTKKQAEWMGDQYVVTDTGTDDEWYSTDGDEWTNQEGHLVESNEFYATCITLCGGPRDGETVA